MTKAGDVVKTQQIYAIEQIKKAHLSSVNQPSSDHVVDEVLIDLELIRPRPHQFTLDAVAEVPPQMEVIESETESLEDTFQHPKYLA